MKWSDKVKWGNIPERMRGGVIRYVENGIPPGHFLSAVFANDLFEAVNRADAENVTRLGDYVRLINCQCPGDCWGAEHIVAQWIKRGGILGNDKHEPLPVYEWSRWADQEYR